MYKLVTYSFEPKNYWNKLSELKSKYLKSNINVNNHLFLIEDNWNDYWKYYTSFNAVINKDNNFLFLGKIKIMKYDASSDEMHTFSYLKQDGLTEKVLGINGLLKKNKYISLTSRSFRSNLNNTFSDFKVDEYADETKCLLNELQDVFYNSDFANNASLDSNRAYKDSLLRDKEEYSMSYLNRFDLIDIKTKYLNIIKELEAKIDDIISNDSIQKNELLIKSLILTAFIQIENYIKDIIRIKPNLEVKDYISETQLLAENYFKTLNDNLNIENLSWKKLSKLFYKLFHISPSGTNKMGELFELRNKLAHTINDVNVITDINDISLKIKEKSYSINGYIFKNLKEFVERISSDMIKQSYTL